MSIDMVSHPKPTPVIYLDFTNNRVFQVVPGLNAPGEHELQLALERSKLVVNGGVGLGASPPQSPDDD
jgi:hypothetical protein